MPENERNLQMNAFDLFPGTLAIISVFDLLLEMRKYALSLLYFLLTKDEINVPIALSAFRNTFPFNVFCSIIYTF